MEKTFYNNPQHHQVQPLFGFFLFQQFEHFVGGTKTCNAEHHWRALLSNAYRYVMYLGRQKHKGRMLLLLFMVQQRINWNSIKYMNWYSCAHVQNFSDGEKTSVGFSAKTLMFLCLMSARSLIATAEWPRRTVYKLGLHKSTSQ